MVKIDITPDTSLIPKLWSSGYSIPQAIAELIDNSIDARTEDDMEISIKLFPDKLTIADRWVGMNFEQIKQAVVLGHSTKEWKLWEFGLWMKTACQSLGKNFKVISKKLWESLEYKVEFNLKDREDNNKWELDVTERERPEDEHYTIVEITDLKVKILQSLEDKLKEDIQTRFWHYLDEISVKLNNKIITPLSVKIEEWTRFEINTKCDYWKITWWVWLTEKFKSSQKYGIHCYRNNRLIAPYNKIGFNHHPTLTRVYWEIHMNFVPVTHNKKSFEIESDEYKKVESILQFELKPILTKAREAKSKERQTDQVVKVTNERNKDTSQALNEIVTEVTKTTPRELPKQDIVHVDKDTTKKVEVEQEVLLDVEPKKGTKKFDINMWGKHMSFTHSYENVWAEHWWKVWKYDSKEKVINIYTNADNPSYYACEDLPFLATIHIAEALTEFMLTDHPDGNSHELYKEIFGAILRRSSEMKEDL